VLLGKKEHLKIRSYLEHVKIHNLKALKYFLPKICPLNISKQVKIKAIFKKNKLMKDIKYTI
jgi:hypothetical protein